MATDQVQIWTAAGLFSAVFRWSGNPDAMKYAVVYGCAVHATQLEAVVDNFGDLILQASKQSPAVVVEMDGGTIVDVTCNQPIRVTILDDDTESGDPDNIRMVGETERYVTDYLPSNQNVDPNAVEQFHQQIA